MIAEGMWQQMAMNSGATMQPGSYPERPGEPDCTYYLRTGLCRFGMSCRFNHPPDRNLVNIRLSKLWLCVILLWITRCFGTIQHLCCYVHKQHCCIVMNHVRLEEILSLNQRHLEFFFLFQCVSVASRNKMQEAMFEKQSCDDVPIWSLLVFNPFAHGKTYKVSFPVGWW